MLEQVNNFQFKNLSSKPFKDGAKQSRLELFKENKEDMTPDDIAKFTNQLLSKLPEGSKLRIRALGADRWATLKTFDSELNVKNEEEYYRGKVKDLAKFMKFSQLEVVVLKPGPKKNV